MKKLIAAAAVVAAAAGSLLGFAGHASAASLTAQITGDPTTGVCITVNWDFPDPTTALPVAIPAPPVPIPVALPNPASGTSGVQCFGPSDLPVPVPSLP